MKNYHIVKHNENYQILLTDIGQLVIRSVDRDFKSFFGLLKLKKQGKYSEKVRLPKYKDKTKGISFVVHGRVLHIKDGKVSFSLTKEFREKYQMLRKRFGFQYLKIYNQ